MHLFKINNKSKMQIYSLKRRKTNFQSDIYKKIRNAVICNYKICFIKGYLKISYLTTKFNEFNNIHNGIKVKMTSN